MSPIILISMGLSPLSFIFLSSDLKNLLSIICGVIIPKLMKKLSVFVKFWKFLFSKILSQASTKITGILLFSDITLIANE